MHGFDVGGGGGTRERVCDGCLSESPGGGGEQAEKGNDDHTGQQSKTKQAGRGVPLSGAEIVSPAVLRSLKLPD